MLYIHVLLNISVDDDICEGRLGNGGGREGGRSKIEGLHGFRIEDGHDRGGGGATGKILVFVREKLPRGFECLDVTWPVECLRLVNLLTNSLVNEELLPVESER